LLIAVSNRYNGGTVSAFDYINDALARRTQRIDAGSATATNAFGYNLRSELASARMGTNAYGYAYDAIGNRLAVTNNAEAFTYTANALNQYTNSTAGSVVMPRYDLDGNLTNYNGWSFAWDGENRLIKTVNGSTVVSNQYDYMSRRVAKTVGSTTHQFLYDDWNLARETTSTGLTNVYVWGMDLSGSLQGEGGIGGLLAVVRNGQTYHPVADANGNITDYVATNGAVVAHYEFDAFGNTVAQSGALADAFAYRFSTKYTDVETGLVCYGFRYYSPELGRWVSREPIGETWCRNLYSFVDNQVPMAVDYLGLQMMLAVPWALGIQPPIETITPRIVQVARPFAEVSRGAEQFTRIPANQIPRAPTPATPNTPTAPTSPTVPTSPTPNSPAPPVPITGHTPPPSSNDNNDPCPCSAKPCSPYKKGTIGYIGPHSAHDHGTIHAPNPHLNLYVVNQNPKTCKCYWNDNDPDYAAPPPQAGWVYLGPDYTPFPVLSP
jgi:RHS repeat-associated protein